MCVPRIRVIWSTKICPPARLLWRLSTCICLFIYPISIIIEVLSGLSSSTYRVFSLLCNKVRRSSRPSLVWHDKKHAGGTSGDCSREAWMLRLCSAEMRSLLLRIRMHSCLWDDCSRIFFKCPLRKTGTSWGSEGSCVKSMTTRDRSACSTLRAAEEGHFLSLFPERGQHLTTFDIAETKWPLPVYAISLVNHSILYSRSP